MMNETKTCSDCGTELPIDAPAGVCPKCLLAAGIAPDPDDTHGAVDDASAVEATVITPSQAPTDEPPLAPTEPFTAEPARTPGIGTRVQYFGDYELLDEIARGGMGVVYKARQVRLNRTVALKMILAGQFASDADVKRFQIEAEAAAQLDHSGIVPVFEVGEHDGHHFFSMGLIEGESLARQIADQPLAPKEAADIVRKIALAVAYAHGHGVIHRDLKPANILIDKDGEPKITDFGLAKRTQGDSGMTASGQILGTPSYMPPEQAGGRIHDVRETADVYSIGAILYTALTGRPPFQADNPLDTLMQVLEREPVSSRQLNPNVPKDLETICHKCLDKHRRRRYQSAQELADELQRFLEGRPINARPLGRPARVWRWCRRNPVVSSLILLAVCLLSGGTIVSTLFGIQATEQRDRAEENAIAANAARDEADAARDEATDARDDATAARDEAKRQALEARRRAYISDINLIQQSVALNNLTQARELLAVQVPPPGQEDERGWEWRYLWQQCRSQAEYQLAEGSNTTIALCIAHDATWAAGYNVGDDAISVWSLTARKQIGRLATSQPALGSSPTDPYLAFVPEETPTQLLVWNPDEQREVVSLNVGDPARTLAFSGDGRFLVAWTGREVVRFRVADWQEVEPRTPTPNWWFWGGGQYAVNHTGNLAAYRTPQQVVLVDLDEGKIRWRRKATDEWLAALAFSSDSKMLASAASFSEKIIRLWSVDDGVEVGRLHGHRGWVGNLHFLPDKDRLLSSSSDRSIRLWDVSRPEQPVVLLTLRGVKASQMAFHPGSQTLITGGKTGTIRVWNLEHVRDREPRRLLPEPVVHWTFASDGRSLLTLNRQGEVKLWPAPDFESGELQFELGSDAALAAIGPRSPRTSALFSPDGRLLAVLATGGKIVLWDVQQREAIHELAVGSVQARPLLFLDDGNRLLVGYPGSSSVHLWNIRTGEEEDLPLLRHFGHGSWTTSADERWVLGLAQNGDGQLLDRQNHEVVPITLETDRAGPSAFTPDHSLLAVSSRFDNVTLWNADTFAKAGEITSFQGSVHSLTFNPDGTRLATGGSDLEAVRLWDVRSWRELLSFEGQGSMFRPIQFSRDGNFLATSPEQGSVHIWRAPSWEEIDAAGSKREALITEEGDNNG